MSINQFQFDDIMARASELVPDFEDVSPSTDDEKIKACRSLSSAAEEMAESLMEEDDGNGTEADREKVIGCYRLAADAFAYAYMTSPFNGRTADQILKSALGKYNTASSFANTDVPLQAKNPERLLVALGHSTFMHDFVDYTSAVEQAIGIATAAMAKAERESSDWSSQSEQIVYLLQEQIYEWGK